VGNSDTKNLLIVAGEPSGDKAAARVAKKILEQAPCRVFGVGGDQMESAGVELLSSIEGLTALGFAQSAKRFGRWARAWASIRNEVEQRTPQVALLVDTPETNLPLARILTEKGVRVVWYVGPQVWAWRKGRLGLLKERTDVVALVLPFEKQLYEEKGVNAAFVGHPILDEPPPKSKELVRGLLGIPPHRNLVAFLPGSRPGEVARHSGEMISAATGLLDKKINSIFAPLPNAMGEELSEAAKAAEMAVPPAGCSARDIIAASDAAIVASGTATLEAAVLGVPLAVVYVLDRLSWAAGRLLARVPYISLPNWVAGRRIVPELLQGDFTADSIVETATSLLSLGEKTRQKQELKRVAQSLGAPGAAERVAGLVLKRLG
jgi:lipid-A-disaccharide synthase